MVRRDIEIRLRTCGGASRIEKHIASNTSKATSCGVGAGTTWKLAKLATRVSAVCQCIVRTRVEASSIVEK